MGHLEREEALAAARGIVERSAADETEVAIESESERFVRFADSGPTQSADRGRQRVAIRARLRTADGWSEGKATCDGLGEAQTAAALARALELARVAAPDPDLLSLEGAFEGMESVGGDTIDAATTTHPFEAKAAWVKEALDSCGASGLVPAGLASTSATAHTLVNSAGRAVHDARSRASLALTASAPGFVTGAGFADQITQRVDELDAESVFRRAIEKARGSNEARSIDPGEYAVVLEPNAVSSILLFAGYMGFGAQEVAEEASFLCGRIGKELFPAALHIADDAGNDVYTGLAFDGEGTPKQRVDLLHGGALTGPVTDAHWANKLGCANTGHALAKPNTEGPKAQNLVVAGGSQSAEQLIAGVDRGLLVTQFHYTNLIDPRELLLTGMTRNGTFLIEGGEVVGAVKNLRFTDSLVNALGRVSGIGAEREVAGALFSGEVVTPALRIDGFRFTSTSDF